MMQTYLLSALVAFAVVLVLGPIVIPMLRRLKFGQVEREEGPDSHKAKQGTPTMGGLMMLCAVLAATLGFGLESAGFVLPALLVTFAFALVGFLDDFIKVRLKRNLGLRAYQKIIAQFAIALLVALWAYRSPQIGPALYLPISGGSWDIGIYYIPLVMLVVIGTTNAVNLPDGLDGLAAGVSMIYSLAMTVVFALLASQASLLGETLYGVNLEGMAVFAAAVTGACLGFMPYNKNPAKMFMGDTGSTFLGYILATYSIQGLFKYYAIVSFAVPFLVLGLPIFDTAFAIVRRVARGQSPMTPDRGHIHHRMMDMGLNQKQTVAALYVVSSLLGLSAVVLTTSGELKAMLLLLTLAAVAYVASRVIFPREIAETAHEKELEQEEMQAKSAAPAPEEKEEKHEEN